MTTEPVPPRQLNPQIPKDLETICVKCLQKDPSRRYESASALAADLGRYHRGEPIHARSISRSERTWRWCKRNPVVASLLAVSVMLLFVSLWTLRGESQQRQAAETQRVAADTQREAADIQRKAADAHRQTAETQLWESLLEQSRSNRLAGNREKSFTAIKEAHRIKPDKKLRTEAIQTIVAPGVTLLHQLPVGWVHSTRFSDDSNLLMVEGSFYEKLLYDQGGGKFLEYSDPPLRDKSGGLKIFRLPQAVEITSISKPLDRVSWVIGESDYTAGRRFNMAPYLLNTDSNLLAVNLAENGKHNIHLWELPSGREAGVLPAGSGACCTFSPSGKFLATEEGGVIELWDLAARTPIRQLGTGRPVAFLTDDDLLVSRKWPNFSVVNTSTGFDMRVGPEGCSLLAIDSQARITVWRGSELNNGQSLRVWNLADNHEVAVYKGQVSEKLNPVSVQISPSGRHVAFDDWGRPGQFTLWDTESGIIQNNCQGAVYGPGDRNLFQHGVFSSEGTIFVAYSKRGNATSDTQSFLKLWDVKNGREFASIENGSCPIISRNGRWLATISPDKDWPSSASSIRNRRCVRIWELTYPVAEVRFDDRITRFEFDRDGKRLAVDSASNSKILNLEQQGEGPHLHSAADLPTDALARFQPDGTLYAIDFPNARSIQVWAQKPSELRGDSKPFKLTRMASPMEQVILESPDIANAPAESWSQEFWDRQNKTPYCWDDKGSFFSSNQHSFVAVLSAAGFSNDPGAFVNKAEISTLASWDIATGRPKIGNDWTRINSLDLSPKGDLAATSGVGAQIWNLDQMGKQHLLKFSFANPTKLDLAAQRSQSNNGPWVHVFEFYAVRFSQDGSQIFAGDAFGRINIGDPYTGRELASWQGHEGAVLSLATCPGGKLLASSGADNVIRIWDIATHLEVGSWSAGDDWITALAYSPDGATLVSGTSSGVVRVWDFARIQHELSSLGMGW